MASHVVIMVFITSHLPTGVENPSATFSAGNCIAGNDEAKKPNPNALPNAPPKILAPKTNVQIIAMASIRGLPSIFDTISDTPNQLRTHNLVPPESFLSCLQEPQKYQGQFL